MNKITAQPPKVSPLGMGEYRKNNSALLKTVGKVAEVFLHASLMLGYIGATVFLGIVCPISLAATIPVGVGVSFLDLRTYRPP